MRKLGRKIQRQGPWASREVVRGSSQWEPCRSRRRWLAVVDELVLYYTISSALVSITKAQWVRSPLVGRDESGYPPGSSTDNGVKWGHLPQGG